MIMKYMLDNKLLEEYPLMVSPVEKFWNRLRYTPSECLMLFLEKTECYIHATTEDGLYTILGRKLWDHNKSISYITNLYYDLLEDDYDLINGPNFVIMPNNEGQYIEIYIRKK